MKRANLNEDRRNGRRFHVVWDAAVEGADQDGVHFEETANLENLSSLGAFLYIPGCLNVGARLDLRLRVPLKKNSWITYAASVIRVRKIIGRVGVAVRFDTAQPMFGRL